MARPGSRSKGQNHSHREDESLPAMGGPTEDRNVQGMRRGTSTRNPNNKDYPKVAGMRTERSGLDTNNGEDQNESFRDNQSVLPMGGSGDCRGGRKRSHREDQKAPKRRKKCNWMTMRRRG